MASVKDYVRMCHAHEDCEGCPLKAEPFTFVGCSIFLFKLTQECERRIDDWCEEHPESKIKEE